MTYEDFIDICRAFPGVTEDIKWGADLTFLIGGKMFAITAFNPDESIGFSFQCSSEVFEELIERDGIIPAPYLARAQWVAVRSWDALSVKEAKELLSKAYWIVRRKLPKGIQEGLAPK